MHQSGHVVAGRDTHIGTVNHHHYGADVPRQREAAARKRRAAVGFVGRAAQRERLRGWMDHRAYPYPLVNVTNGPGSGKTALALCVARDVAADYPGGQLFLEVSQAGLPEFDAHEVLFRLLLQLRVAESRIPDSLAGRIELFHAELREGTLLVLDNVTSAAQVRDLLPDRDDCGVLMTSRRSFAELEGIREIDLGRMPEDEAYTLLEERVGTARIGTDPAAAREIVRLCGALPLALHMAGAQLGRPSNRRLSLASFAQRLAAKRLDVLSSDHQDLRASFALSYLDLTPAAARLFRLLSLVAVPDFCDELAAAVDGTEAWSEALAELFDTHLIEPVGETRARFHDLMKVFAQERAEAEDTAADRDAAVDRALAWCVESAARWGRHVGVDGRRSVDEGRYEDALAGLDAEHRTLTAAIRQAAETGRDDLPWRIVAQLGGFFEVRGHWADWLEGADLAIASATKSGDRVALGVARYARSWPLRLQRRLTEAVEESVAALRLLDGLPERADVLSHLGTLYRETHRYEESVACLDEAAELFRADGDEHGEGLVLRTLGHVQFWRRDLDGAAATLVRAIELLHRVGDRAAEGWSHNNLLSVRGAQWRLDDARHHYAEALGLFTQIEHPQGQAWAHNHLGRIVRQYGRTEEAIGLGERALVLFDRIGDGYGIPWALTHLGVARQDAAQLRKANALFAAMEVPEADGEGTTLVQLARLTADPSLLDEALRHFETIGSLHGQATALLARADLAVTDPAAARHDYETALSCFRRTEDPYGEAQALLGLAALDPDSGRTAAATAILTRLGLPQP
ncbi:hypothetical protein GCM10027589_39240 [Actinocorallia lasiicapitis]